MSKMLQLVNEERARHNKPALIMDPCLLKAAKAHSDAQARENKMGHLMPGEDDLLKRVKSVSPEGKWTIWAENVGAGSQSEETMMRSWIKSPSHHKNITGAHTHFAAAMSTSAQGKFFWTQVFANDGSVCPEDGRPMKEHQHNKPKHQITDEAAIERMLQLVNKQRVQHGCRPLFIDQCLVRAAQLHSDLQGQAASMSHRLPDEPDLITRVTKVSEGKSWVGWAENVGFGSKKEDVMMESWMNSPKHRENILADYTHMGTAMAVGVDNKPYWTQVFANDGSTQEEDNSMPTPPLSPLPHEEAPGEEQLQSVLKLVNEERQKTNLSLLALDDCLIKAAQLHSEAQAGAGKMSHQLPDEADLVARVNEVTAPNKRWMAWGENVGFGNDNERVVMSMWMNSPQHRDNILGNYTHMGIGIAHRNGKPYWTQVFGTMGKPTSGDEVVETIIEYVSTNGKPRPASTITLTPSAMAAKMAAALDLVNEERAKCNKRPLIHDPRLAQAAHDHCMEQACAGQMSHQLPGEPDLVSRINAVSKGRQWSAWAENVGFGSADEKLVMDVWLKSPQHRDNILGDYTHFGIAMANDANNKPYWTQLFAQLDEDDEKPFDGMTYENDVYVTVVTKTTTTDESSSSSTPPLSRLDSNSGGHTSRVTHTVEVIESSDNTPVVNTKSSYSSNSSSIVTPSPTSPINNDNIFNSKRSSNPFKRISFKVSRGSVKSTSTSDTKSTTTSKPPVKQLFKSIFGSIGRSSKGNN
ncbi:hypothetical protein BDF19DRAFT_412716 [Syncephalis fuscata]|nr:hypothetical protein BDF19DRAFT_412716 [Syncephalis fuscata]